MIGMCDHENCRKEGTLKLLGPKCYCREHFDSICADENRPAISPTFGPSVLRLKWDSTKVFQVPYTLAKDCVDSKIKEFTEFKGDMTHTIGSNTLLNEYRLAIVEGKIEPYHIMMTFKGE